MIPASVINTPDLRCIEAINTFYLAVPRLRLLCYYFKVLFHVAVFSLSGFLPLWHLFALSTSDARMWARKEAAAGFCSRPADVPLFSFRPARPSSFHLELPLRVTLPNPSMCADTYLHVVPICKTKRLQRRKAAKWSQNLPQRSCGAKLAVHTSGRL